jgi:hypothetical protein
MAKGQKRGNREIRKPKKEKAPEAPARTTFMPRGPLTAGRAPARKK